MLKKQNTLERYLDALLKGARKQCREVIEETLQTGIPANSVYADVIWPIMVEIESLLRAERITPVQEHLATRINRTIVAQLQNKLPRRPCKYKKMAIASSEEQLQELGAQMIADLFESDGWEVKFLGGGLTNDDVLTFVHEYVPDILLIYGTSPRHAPATRQLIDTIRNVNAFPNMRIMVAGGLFNRAEGLWQEIGADMFAATPFEALQIASSDAPLPTNQPTINRRKKARQNKIQASNNPG